MKKKKSVRAKNLLRLAQTADVLLQVCSRKEQELADEISSAAVVSNHSIETLIQMYEEYGTKVPSPTRALARQQYEDVMVTSLYEYRSRR